ncbi:MAG: hypothetical protein ACOYNI_07945 [Acidimicrobiia bacterium]
MTLEAGVLRDADSLRRAIEVSASVLATAQSLHPVDVYAREVINLATVASLLARAAVARKESRGTHTRLDFAGTSDEFLGRLVCVGDASPHLVRLPAEEPVA